MSGAVFCLILSIICANKAINSTIGLCRFAYLYPKKLQARFLIEAIAETILSGIIMGVSIGIILVHL